MKEIIFGLIPGSIFFYRYSPKVFSGATVGLILMEIVPFLLIAVIESIDLLRVAVGFFMLYGLYELGYIENDIKAKSEVIGATIRTQFLSFRYKLFLIFRIPVIGLLSILAITGDVNIPPIAIVSLLAVMLAFFIHNRLKGGVFRVSSFLVLNNLKIIARILVLSPFLGLYFMAAVPHIVIKTLHYINAKEIVSIDDSAMKGMTLPVYIGFMVSFIYLDPHLIVITTPYLINHTKSIFYSRLKFILKAK